MLVGDARRLTDIEVDGDAGVEHDVLEQAFHGRGRRVQAIAIGVQRPRENQRQAVGAVHQVVERLLVGFRRIGVVDPLHQRPGGARRAARDRRCPHGARVERLDPDAVIGLGHQLLLERGAFERGIDKFAPFRLAGRRKFSRKREFVGLTVSHGIENGTFSRGALLS